MPFEFRETYIPDVLLIKSRIFSDHRGALQEVFKQSVFEKFGLPGLFVQDNLTRSSYGVLRGLHYQRQPYAQGKLITVLEGEIYDVAVDLRRGSPTYGDWVSIRLSPDHSPMLYVPEGFGHGFQVLSEKAVVMYKLTAEYAPDFEAGIIWNDSRLGITWPLEEPVLSEKDTHWPSFEEAEIDFVYQEGDL